MADNQFVGTWKLVSFEFRDDDGQVIYLYGKDPIGYIMYAEDGYMSVVIMTANRPKFATGNILRGTTEEKADAASTYLSYCGKYEILDGKVIHHVEASLFPNWVGVDQERFFEFQGDRLLLSTPPIMYNNGQRLTAYVLWERV